MADFIWNCGKNDIYGYLPHSGAGLCTRVMLIQETNILSYHSDKTSEIKSLDRFTRSTVFETDDKVYTDAIGVPRGVPDEFKARNTVAGGLTAVIPLIGPVIETSKNTEWINYIHYNQQRMANISKKRV